VAGLADGAEQYAALSRRLKEAGETGLARQLRKALNEAAKPITREITDAAHLRRYMPAQYADTVAADLKVSTLQSGSVRNPGVRISAQGRVKKRKVVQLDAGVLHHPLFGDRGHWYPQLRGMREGFFTDPCEQSAPDVRDKIEAAMAETAAQIRG
jgi:hypothetical protein